MTTTPDFEAQAREIAFDIMSVGWREEGKPKDIIFYDDEIEPKLFTAISSALLRAFELGCQAGHSAACEPSSSLRSSSSENGGEAGWRLVADVPYAEIWGQNWLLWADGFEVEAGKRVLLGPRDGYQEVWLDNGGDHIEFNPTHCRLFPLPPHTQSPIEEAGSADEVSAANTSASLTPHQEEA